MRCQMLLEHSEDEAELMPVTESLLRKTAMLIRSPPPDVPLRAGDAIHTATWLETGETEIWTNDRHLLAAVAHFGLAGRSFATIR